MFTTIYFKEKDETEATWGVEKLLIDDEKYYKISEKLISDNIVELYKIHVDMVKIIHMDKYYHIIPIKKGFYFFLRKCNIDIEILSGDRDDIPLEIKRIVQMEKI